MTHPSLATVQRFFTQRALKESWGIQKALQEHTKVTPRALEHKFSTQALKDHLETRALKAVGYLSTRALEALEQSENT